MQAYTTWAVVGRLLVGWLDERQLGLGVLGQADIEACWPPSRPRATTSGISSAGLPSAGWVTHLEVPVLASRTGTALEEERRWQIVQRLLHDDSVDLTDGVAGYLLLLYAQPLSRIVAIKLDDVIARGDGVRLRLGDEEPAIPEPLGGLVDGLAATGRRDVGVGTAATVPWLFPGLLPGQPLTVARLGNRMGKLGVDARAGRRAALLHLAARLPAAVLSHHDGSRLRLLGSPAPTARPSRPAASAALRPTHCC